MRTPLSKQRNKHLQTVLIEAAKMAPRNSPELAMVYEQEKQKGNANRATLAVARKMVAYLVAVDRRQNGFLVVKQKSHRGVACAKYRRSFFSAQPARSRQLPTRRRSISSRGPHQIVSRLAGDHQINLLCSPRSADTTN